MHCRTLYYSLEHCHTLYYYQEHCHTLCYYQEHCHTLCYYQEHCHTLYYYQEHCHTLYNCQEHCDTLCYYLEYCNTIYFSLEHYDTLYCYLKHCDTTLHPFLKHCDTLYYYAAIWTVQQYSYYYLNHWNKLKNSLEKFGICHFLIITSRIFPNSVLDALQYISTFPEKCDAFYRLLRWNTFHQFSGALPYNTLLLLFYVFIWP